MNMNRLSEEFLTHIRNFKISSADTDFYGRLKLSGLINFLIQPAITSADKLGFGVKYLNENNLLWVLSRFDVEIYKTMKWYDELTVETWPKTIDGIFYIRDFIMRDKNNEIVAKSTSAWLAIDTIRRRPKVITGIVSETFHALKHKNSIEKPPIKLAKKEGEETKTYKIGYSDLDLNKHLTTTRYIELMVDCFSMGFHQKNYPSKITVNFLKESKPEEEIKIFKNQLNEKSFHFEGINLTNNLPSFRAEITF